MVADHYTNPDDSDVRVEAEQDAGDLYCGEGNRHHISGHPGFMPIADHERANCDDV
jgi:hypothetical protein